MVVTSKKRLRHTYHWDRVRPFWSHVLEWKACNDTKLLVLLDVGYIVVNVNPPWKYEQRVVFHEILDLAPMVILMSRKKAFMRVQPFLSVTWFFFLGISLESKSDAIQKVRKSIEEGHTKEATLESSFPPLPAHGTDVPRPPGPHPHK